MGVDTPMPADNIGDWHSWHRRCIDDAARPRQVPPSPQ
jgi:hypothetical protein